MKIRRTWRKFLWNSVTRSCLISITSQRLYRHSWIPSHDALKTPPHTPAASSFYVGDIDVHLVFSAEFSGFLHVNFVDYCFIDKQQPREMTVRSCRVLTHLPRSVSQPQTVVGLAHYRKLCCPAVSQLDLIISWRVDDPCMYQDGAMSPRQSPSEHRTSATALIKVEKVATCGQTRDGVFP